jgi:hypothetical protein
MVALTFDDGPVRARTVEVLNQLQMHGAEATFFLIGDQMERNRDVVQREHDEGHTVASHTYNHYQPANLNSKIIFEHKALFDKLLTDMIGVPAPYMRAPGGRFEFYVDNKIGLPIIQWSFIVIHILHNLFTFVFILTFHLLFVSIDFFISLIRIVIFLVPSLCNGACRFFEWSESMAEMGVCVGFYWCEMGMDTMESEDVRRRMGELLRGILSLCSCLFVLWYLTCSLSLVAWSYGCIVDQLDLLLCVRVFP